MPEKEYSFITVNTATVYGARQAIAMRKSGWDIVEVNHFWLVKLKKKKPDKQKP
jgi:hypothetical protein